MKVLKKIVKQVTFLLCVSVFLTGGCVPVIYHRPIPPRYEPIDSMTNYRSRVEYVYVPRFRPKPMYYWDGMWYDEPYTYIVYQDVWGRVTPRKIPRRIMKNIERQRPQKFITPQRRPVRNNDRNRIRKRIEKR